MNRPDAPRPGSGRGGPGAPSPAAEPVFAEPWEAQAFGLATSLRASGLLDRDEWTAALAAELEGQDASRRGGDYYRCWLAALERLLAERGFIGSAELEATTAAWQRAAHATPHGEPILLENDPMRAARGRER